MTDEQALEFEKELRSAYNHCETVNHSEFFRLIDHWRAHHDIEQKRFELVKAALAGSCANSEYRKADPSEHGNFAIRCADAAMKELGLTEDGE